MTTQTVGAPAEALSPTSRDRFVLALRVNDDDLVPSRTSSMVRDEIVRRLF
jgi:hypothetical protein